MNKFRFGLAAVAVVALIGCKCARPATTDAGDNLAISASESPLDALKAGNERFVEGHPIHLHQDSDRRTEVAAGQHPIAVIVGCSDSRVPPEIIFDQGLGDLFVVRVAGNVVDDHALGSIEYAVEHLHVKLVIVLGHDKCGAVQAAVSGGEMPGHIQSIVDAIQPAVVAAKTEPGDLLDNAIDENARNTAGRIHDDPILNHEIAAGELDVEAARYKLDSGRVEFLTARQYGAGSMNH